MLIQIGHNLFRFIFAKTSSITHCQIDLHIEYLTLLIADVHSFVPRAHDSPPIHYGNVPKPAWGVQIQGSSASAKHPPP